MPTPQFQWLRYRVIPAQLKGLRALSLNAAPAGDAEPMEMELPDLSAFSSPLDKALVLLHTAAEIEHMLMVQYLYASFSLREAEEAGGLEPENNPARIALLEEWRSTLMNIGQQEMGHLMTVQNLLLLTRLPLNLEREDMPPRKNLYPFPMHLEALTHTSLAKYVVAEAPPDAEGVSDIIELATGAAGQLVNHVGVLYALLGVVFSREGGLDDNADLHEWYVIVRDTAQLAYQQQAPAAWHLPDDAFDATTTALQGGPQWSRPSRGLNVHVVDGRASALEALRDISVQGEGPGTDGEDTHFELFLTAFRGRVAPPTPPFPDGADWRPSRSVPTDPQISADGARDSPSGITHPWAKIVARLADAYYALLLGCIEHHLLTAVEADRTFLRQRAIGGMRRIANLAGILSMLPQRADGTGVAAVPFTLPPPDTLHMPANEFARWELHRSRLHSVIELGELAGEDVVADRTALATVQQHLI